MAEDVKALEDAARVSFDDIKNDLNTLLTNYKNAKKLSESINVNDPSMSAFSQKILPFLNEAEGQVKTIEDSVNEANTRFAYIIDHFGIPKPKQKTYDPNTFFSPFKEFLKNFQSALTALNKPAAKQYRPVGQKLNAAGNSADPIANLANALKMGQLPPRLTKKN